MNQDIFLALFIMNVIITLLMAVIYYGIFIPQQHEKDRKRKIRELEEEYEKIFQNDKPNSIR